MGTNTIATTTKQILWWDHKGVLRASKRPVTNMVYRCISKEVEPLFKMAPNTKIQSSKRVGSSIDSSAAGLTVMRNTLVNPLEPLQRGLSEGTLTNALTTVTSVVTKSILKLPYSWEGRPEPQ